MKSCLKEEVLGYTILGFPLRDKHYVLSACPSPAGNHPYYSDGIQTHDVRILENANRPPSMPDDMRPVRILQLKTGTDCKQLFVIDVKTASGLRMLLFNAGCSLC